MPVTAPMLKMDISPLSIHDDEAFGSRQTSGSPSAIDLVASVESVINQLIHVE